MRILRILGPGLVALALVGLIEVGLRVLGRGDAVPGAGDPYLNLTPFFERATRTDGVPVMRRRDQGAEFTVDKAPNGFRVFVLGESSVYGFPYGPGYAFAAFLQERLARALPGFVVEVVNCGVDGIGSWHVRRIADEVARHQPDVVLVYTGHNDFVTPEIRAPGPILTRLARLRFYQLAVRAGRSWRRWRRGPIDEDALWSANQPYGPARLRALGRETLSPTDRARILARFETNLEAVVDSARAAGAVPVVASLTQDIRDWAPGAWRHTAGLSGDAIARWTRYAKEGDRRRRAGDCRRALAAFHAAMRIDRRPAALHYARARCFAEQGRWRTAGREYRRASDLDEVPLGAPSVVNLSIRRLAARRRIPFIDVEDAVERASPHGLVGRALVIDPVHPSLAGHQVIAAAIAHGFRRHGLPVPASRWADAEPVTVDPDGILREHPRLARREHESRILLHLMLGRTDRALSELVAAEGQFPELRPATEQVAHRLTTDGGLAPVNSPWR
jgi:lysophospholipase L1-like esterase